MLIFAHGWSLNKDAPGHRLIFYLKGCNLRCRYCGNPESMSPHPEVLFYPDRAGRVDPASCCPYPERRCRACERFECVKLWRHPAFELAGEELSLAALLEQAEQSRSIFGADGGITFGGGEPMMQAAALLPAIRALRERGFHVAVESNASLPPYRELIGLVDYLISDCKAIDDDAHRRLTGSGNQLILEQLELAAVTQAEFLIRVPLVTGYNTSPEELERFRVRFGDWHRKRLAALNRPLTVQSLRLHHMGEPKYRALEQPYPLHGVEPPAPELEAALQESWRRQGIRVLQFDDSER